MSFTISKKSVPGIRGALAALCLLLASGCATTSGDARDPFEGFNRAMYGFNESLDEAVVKPVATAYKESLPEIVQIGVRNFFSNLEDIFIGVNNLLQGKPVEAASDWTRVALNTVFGGVGLLDWASEIGLEKHNEDFGQTFGRWGVGDGPYLVWPVLGSSTLRDTAGRIIDIRVDPLRNHKPIATRNVLILTNGISRRAYLLDASRLLEEAALDKYVFQRDAHLQRRRSLIHDGSPPRESASGRPFSADASVSPVPASSDSDVGQPRAALPPALATSVRGE